MNFVEWVIGALLLLFFVFLAVRLGSKAHYNSKREYIEWLYSKGKDILK